MALTDPTGTDLIHSGQDSTTDQIRRTIGRATGSSGSSGSSSGSSDSSTPDSDPPDDDPVEEGDPFVDDSGNPVTNGMEAVYNAVENARDAGNELSPSAALSFSGSAARVAANAHVAAQDRTQAVADRAGLPWQWIAVGAVAVVGALGLALGGDD